nr:hypothetical protein [uncultured Parabacteroides sp.]
MKRIACLSLVVLSLVACSKDDEYRSVELDLKTVKLDIADAKMLALCENGTKTKSSSGDIDLLKIDEKGKMYSVFWIAPGTTDTIRIIPHSILPLANEFVLFSNITTFCSNPNAYYYLNYNDSYIIRKKDGAIFVIDDMLFDDGTGDEFDIQGFKPRIDKLNNAFCLSGSDVYKFALSNLDDITMQRITLDQFPLDCRNHPFEVDRDGNCITRTDRERTILYKSEGGMYEFPQSDGVFNYFVGYNGDLYCCSFSDKDWQNSNRLYKIFPLEIGVQVSYDLENAASKKTQTNYVWSGSKLHTLENGYIHVFLATDDTNNMLVYNSKNGTIKEVGFLPGTMEEVVGISNNCIYRIMDHKIYKYDFAAGEKEVTPIDFDFSTCTVYKDWIAYNVPDGSKFILGAIRNSDMAILRIEVDMETGKTTVFEDMQDRPIVTLVQL